MRIYYISSAYLYYRTAMKKSGPTVTSFLKEMDQQMGVAIVGFAAYRDEGGKLCTFAYVTLFLFKTHFSYRS